MSTIFDLRWMNQPQTLQTPVEPTRAPKMAREEPAEGDPSDVISFLVASDCAHTQNSISLRLPDTPASSCTLHTVHTLDQAKTTLARDQYDIVILDMKPGDEHHGFALPELGQRPVYIVLGDEPQMAQTAFDLGAIDFVLRDATGDRMQRALERAVASLDTPTQAAAPKRTDISKQWIRAARNGELVSAQLKDTIYFEAERKFTRVVLPNTDAYLRMGINTVARELDSRLFWRIHRSTIINAGHIETVRRDDFGRVQVRMRGQTRTLQVSKAYEHMLYREGIF